MKKSTSIVKTVIIIIMALVIALDTVFIFILSNSINAVDQRVTEQEVCLPSNHADDSGFSLFSLYKENLLHQHTPVLLYHMSDYKEVFHSPTCTSQPEFLLPSTGHPVFCF